VEELHDWLTEQSGGLRTYLEFQKKSLALARTDTANASILSLLGNAAGRFAARFEGQPLSVDAAETAISRLRSLVAEARLIQQADAPAKMRFANKVALTDLVNEGTPNLPN
jgi:hypothetical protein